uniref:Uncharacterized protein n=1 Tax=Oryza brachyantha TaxID=4533 RepID=J3MVY5_ORYBR
MPTTCGGRLHRNSAPAPLFLACSCDGGRRPRSPPVPPAALRCRRPALSCKYGGPHSLATSARWSAPSCRRAHPAAVTSSHAPSDRQEPPLAPNSTTSPAESAASPSGSIVAQAESDAVVVVAHGEGEETTVEEGAAGGGERSGG